MNKDRLSRVLVLLLFLAPPTSLFAQTDANACQQNRVAYQDALRAKDYPDARRYWKQAHSTCVRNIKSMYVQGIKIYRGIIKQEQDYATKQLQIDSLFWIYDERITYIGEEGYVRGRKGSDMMRFREEEADKALFELAKCHDLEGIKMEAPALQYYLLANDYAFHHDQIDRDTWYNHLERMLILLDEIRAGKDPVAENTFFKLFGEVDFYCRKHMTCDEMVATIKARLKAHPEMKSICREGLKLLHLSNCLDNDLFYDLMDCTIAHGDVHDPRDLVDVIRIRQGCDTMRQAIEKLLPTAPDSLKEWYYLEIAKCYLINGNYPKTRTYAEKALAINPNSGKAYIYIGDAYSASRNSCAVSGLCQIKAVFWIAEDMYQKAKQVDPAVAKLAVKKIKETKAMFPTVNDCFYESLQQGAPYTVGCWINRGTSVKVLE